VRFPAFYEITLATAPPFVEKKVPIGSPPFLDHVHRSWVADDAGASLAVHPAQLYEAASLFLLAALLVAASPYKRRHGDVFGLLCVLNAVVRFGVELVRRDTAPVAFGLSAGQVGALLVLAIGVGIPLWVRRRGAGGAEPA
jgi:prolipoprotein diacylglyceryltransferase